jgi:GT2 family glycosyltransferase
MKTKGSAVSMLVGIPMHKTGQPFIDSLTSFLKECEGHYKIEAIAIGDKSLVEAQNAIGEYFIDKTNHKYLLMLEDDHTGHSRNMLKALLRKDEDVVGMNYYSRHFPYYSCCMRKVDSMGENGEPLFAGRHETSGYVECDLVGYGMTLYKRSVFETLDRPYFRLNKFSGEGSYATDIDFCERLKQDGIKMFGCFDYTLAHRHVNKDNVFELRNKEMIERNQLLIKERGYMI